DRRRSRQRVLHLPHREHLMAVRHYMNTDSGAPTLSGTNGDLINLLDKILCVGYGSKTAAGWTKPYTATNQAVFQPGGGVQHFFHVDDNSPNATSGAKEGPIRGSETASAVLTGTGFFPTTSQIAAGAGEILRKSATADATQRAWQAFADDRTCILALAPGDGAGAWSVHYFGELFSLLASGA